MFAPPPREKYISRTTRKINNIRSSQLSSLSTTPLPVQACGKPKRAHRLYRRRGTFVPLQCLETWVLIREPSLGAITRITYARKYAQGAELRLTSGSLFLVGDAAHPSCDSPNTSRRFALGASDVCLVGENPARPVPAL